MFQNAIIHGAEDRVKAVEGPQKSTEDQDRLMPLKPRKEKLSRGKALVRSIRSYGFSLWFTHTYAKLSELPSLCLVIFQAIGI